MTSSAQLASTVCRACALAFACLAVMATETLAEIKIKVMPDGSRVIYNDPPKKRARKAAAGLQVPRPYMARLIDHHAARTGLDPRLVRAVIQVESGYRMNARSSKGAMGLMQLMPETARDLRVADAYDPDENVRGGTTYLRRLLGRFQGDLQLTLAAYNAGPTTVDRYGGVPPYRETRNYIRKVLRLYSGRTPEIRQASRATKRPAPRPTPIYVVRDANDQVVFTTQEPPSRPN